MARLLPSDTRISPSSVATIVEKIQKIDGVIKTVTCLVLTP